jgi:hypothetical protein
MTDNLSNPFDNVILEDISDYAIKVGDKIFVSNGQYDIEGFAMIAVCYPYDSILKIREDDRTEINVKGWLADEIEINGVSY